MKSYYSNGKLLLTGEYLVLDGATALAIPTVYGQSLMVDPTSTGLLEWASKDELGVIWFSAVFSSELEVQETNDAVVAQTLTEILKTAQKLNPAFLGNNPGLRITATLGFPRNWGLGTSSTLINNIAQWADVDAFKLLEKSFGGSGYDIAAAQVNSPLLYTRKKDRPIIEPVALNWDFKDQLFFVHLNRKQDSKEGIARYRALSETHEVTHTRISQISLELPDCASRELFIDLMNEHETLLSNLLQLPTVKEALFQDFPGLVKSLGAWGGDFVLASGGADAMQYFRKKGYETIVPFSEMIK